MSPEAGSSRFLLPPSRQPPTSVLTLNQPRPRSEKSSRSVSVTDLRRHTSRLLRAVARGRTVTVTHRRKALARLIPLGLPPGRPAANDPFYRLGDFAQPMGVLNNEQIDQAVYGL